MADGAAIVVDLRQADDDALIGGDKRDMGGGSGSGTIGHGDEKQTDGRS